MECIPGAVEERVPREQLSTASPAAPAAEDGRQSSQLSSGRCGGFSARMHLPQYLN
jgi:hypothetical protein